ncbi:MAG: bifunctional diguanylate cyclase/phosphodiesterase [Eubacteriales bacterium]|nr:bifunctional diguanylate cyclase/phosphodiesterase [Eubacteriales bacterium]
MRVKVKGTNGKGNKNIFLIILTAAFVVVLFTCFLLVLDAARLTPYGYQDIAVIISLLVALLFIWLAIVLFIIYSRNKKQLSKLAYVDPITHGYSCVRFEMEAAGLIHSAPSGTYSFITLNIAKFKLINDAYGIHEGDRTLKYVYDVLSQHLCDGELLCRSSSDHFDLLVKSASQQEHREYIQNIVEVINSFNQGRKQKYYLKITAGVYLIKDSSMSIVHIRDRANVARKISSSSIGNHLYSCTFYSDYERQKQQREKRMENRMEDALRNEEFLIYLQPKVSLANEQITGAEALVRWMDPEQGMLQPMDFISFFEGNGFIIHVDLYVFQGVCKLIRKWLDAGVTPIPVSVNLSRLHLNEKDFLEPFMEIQKKYKIPPSLIEVELTETLLYENPDAVIRLVDEIHNAGFLCSLDDFGSGYSSLNMLKDIKVDILKLDKAFLCSPRADNPRERAIIQSVVNLAKKLKMETVSEGVETEEQFTFLKEINCDKAQGFVISRPVPVDVFEKLAFGKNIVLDENVKIQKS